MTDVSLETLLSRVTDRTATPRDWKTIDCRAAGRPEVWSQLADLLRDDAALREVVRKATEKADLVEPEFLKPPRRLSLPRSVMAASVLLLVCGAFLAGRSTVVPRVAEPQPAARLTSAEAFTAYIREGVAERTVLGELPPVVVTARETGRASEVEVVSVRRVLERHVTDRLVQVVHDELGRPRQAPVELARFIPTESF